jgi:tRNA 2-thiouridine synthesizing protein A
MQKEVYPVSFVFDQELDCSGMACPMPILKTKKAVDGMQVGQVLKMIATDPGATSDMDAWTKKTGHELVGSEQDAGKFIFYIKKAK